MNKNIKNKIVNFIGIDVAKFKLDIFLLSTGEYKTIENTEESILKFIDYIKENKDLNINEENTVIMIDLTGGYEYLIKNTLYNNNFKNIILAEGRKVKSFSKSLLHNKAKNDKIDCQILAEYGKTFLNELNFYIPNNENRKLINDYYMRVVDLKQLKSQEKNRYSAPALNSKIKSSIKNHIELLENEIKILQNEIDVLINNDKELKIISDLLQNEKGIKTEISQLLIATLPELGRVDRRQIAGITGTAPISRDSGTIRGYRFTTGGRRIIKKYLFICILSQIRYNEVYKNKMEEMRSRGKSKMQCIVAIMRKFIVILNAKVRCELIKNDLL